MLKPNSYIHRIDKDLVQQMPLTAFGGEVIIVDSPDRTQEAVDYLSQQPILGVDTESRPSFTRGVHYPTALLQIASEERCYLFRLTHIGMPQIVADLFANPNITKVGLAFKDDINGLRRRRPFVPVNCVDLQLIAWKYGILDMGLQKLFAICFGKKISKAQQLTNWENSHLTAEQARYASTDAWATLLIYKDLLATKPLSKKQADAIRQADKEAQIAHQQEVLAARQAAAALLADSTLPNPTPSPTEATSPSPEPKTTTPKKKKSATKKKKTTTPKKKAPSSSTTKKTKTTKKKKSHSTAPLANQAQ